MPDIDLNPDVQNQEIIAEKTDAEIRNSISSFFDSPPIESVDNNEEIQEEEIPEVDDTSEEEEVEIDEADNSEVDEDEEILDELEEEEDDEEEDDEEEEEELEDEEEVLEEDSKESSYLYTNEEGKQVFLEAVDPETGESSRYLTREKAEEGLVRQLSYIGELKTQLSEERENANSKIQQLENDLSFFQRSINKDEARKALIVDKLPEKFKNVDVTTMSSDEEVKAYKTALLDAEIEVDREIRKANEERIEANKKSQEAQDRALSHVRSRSTDLEFFGFTNSEDRMILRDKLKEKPEGVEYTHSDIAVSLSKAYGNNVADQYLKSVVGNESPIKASPEVKPEKVTKKTVKKPTKKKVETVKKKTRPKKVKAPTSTSDKPKISAKRKIANAFNNL